MVYFEYLPLLAPCGKERRKICVSAVKLEFSVDLRVRRCLFMIMTNVNCH